MNTRRKILSGAASMTALAAMSSNMELWAQSGPIRIGMIAPLSSGGEMMGRPLTEGAHIAVEQINKAGGVNGRPLELVVRDDKLSAQEAVVQARDLFGQGVKLIVGGLTTATSLAISPLAHANDAAFIACSAVADQLTHEDFHPHFFRMTENAYTKYRSLAKLIAERAPTATVWAGVIPDAANARSIWSSLKDGLKEFYPSLAKKDITILDPIVTKVGATDFKNTLAQLMASPATAFFNCTNGADAITFLTQAQSYNISRKFSVIADAGSGWTVPLALGKKVPPTFWMPVHWWYAAYQDIPAGKALYDAYVARTGKAFPDEFIELSHAAVNAYAEAIKKAGSTDAKAVVQALEGLQWNAAKGTRRFRKEDHQCIADVVTVRLEPRENERGWDVAEAVKKPAEETLDAPAPGQPVKYRFE